MTKLGVRFSQITFTFISERWQWYEPAPSVFSIVTQWMSFPESLRGSWANCWSVHCLPQHTDQWVRGGSYSNADQRRKTHFVRTRVDNWKCSTLTAFHAWHTSEAILSDNIMKVSGGFSVLFCLLYYEDVGAVSKWVIPRITLWNGNVIFRKQAEWSSHFMLEQLSTP